MADLSNNPEYMQLRFKEVDLYFGQLLTVCKAAVIESKQGNNQDAIDWIISYLDPRDEMPPDSEVDADKYFAEHASKIEDELYNTHMKIQKIRK